ncbi:MAG: hypothetical protein KBT31_05440, partial [Firmicutes bacterium]|nr:hypothetical protein [Candidatus Colimorpha enterica]
GGASANNIVNSIYDKGADFVIGFTSGLYVGEGQIWVKTFLKGLIPNENYYFSIRDADYAVAFAMHSNIEACDVYNRLIRGDVYSSIDE